jgi:NTE family protein
LTRRTLVLSAGGPGGTAWLLGFIHGALEHGVDLGQADRVIGTSAGALAGAALTCGTLDHAVGLYRRSELPVVEYPATLEQFVEAARRVSAGASSRDEEVRRIANLEPLGPRLIPAATMRLVSEAHVPSADWPDTRLEITATDADTGRRVVFDAGSGAALTDALTASCTGAGMAPLVTIDGRRYADGALRSPFNADLAAGSDAVLVLIPVPLGERQPDLDDEVASLGDGAVHVIASDAASLSPIGEDPLSMETVRAALDAGMTQAGAHADELRSFWNPGAG